MPKLRPMSDELLARSLRELMRRVLELPNHDKGYEFHCVPTHQGLQLFDKVPSWVTPLAWDEFYTWLVKEGYVQKSPHDFTFTFYRMEAMEAMLLRPPLPASELCAQALRAFERRVGQHMVNTHEGPAWVSRVGIPVAKEGLVLATPEVIVNDEEWKAILLLLDDRGIWVPVSGQGFEVDRDKLASLIDEFDNPRRGTKENPFEVDECVRTRGAKSPAIVEDRDLDLDGPAMYTVKFDRGTRAWLAEGDLEVDPAPAELDETAFESEAMSDGQRQPE